MSNSTKSPGRTPPFVLVALVLLVFILGYNYWTLSSSNKTLRELNSKLEIQSRDSAEGRLNVEKNLESAREELRILQENLEQVKKSSQDKEIELNNVRGESKRTADDVNQCKDSLAKCDSDLQVEKTNVEKITAEKATLESDLKAKEAQKVECGAAECVKPVKDVLQIITKLVGTDAVTNTLTSAGLDGKNLMEGLPRIEAPAQPTPAKVKEEQAGSKNKTNQVSSTLHATPASKNASENLKFVSDKKIPENEAKLGAQNKDLSNSQTADKNNLKTEADYSEATDGTTQTDEFTTVASQVEEKKISNI